MSEINIHEAKTHFSKLINRVSAGEEIIICRAGKPVARLLPIQSNKPPRILGRDAGKIWIADDFDDPLPPEMLDEWYK